MGCLQSCSMGSAVHLANPRCQKRNQNLQRDFRRPKSIHQHCAKGSPTNTFRALWSQVWCICIFPSFLVYTFSPPRFEPEPLAHMNFRGDPYGPVAGCLILRENLSRRMALKVRRKVSPRNWHCSMGCSSQCCG